MKELLERKKVLAVQAPGEVPENINQIYFAIRFLRNVSPETMKIRFWQIGNSIRSVMGLAHKN